MCDIISVRKLIVQCEEHLLIYIYYTQVHMTNSQKHSLHTSDRKVMGKTVSKLRKMGQVPGNIFGEEQASKSVSLNKSDLVRHLKSEGDSGLIYLVVEGDSKEEIPALIDEVQYNPVNEEPLHISFKRVNLKEKVQQEVPVEIVGEANIPGANIFLTRDVLEVEALPADLPESITVDISGLTEIGQSLHLSDAQYDRNKVKVLISEEEQESPLVLVQEVKEEVEEAPAEPAEGEAAPAEGAAPAAEAPAAE